MFKVEAMMLVAHKAHSLKVQAKINRRQQHKYNGNAFYRRAVKIPQTGIVGGKTADSHCGKAMTNSIKKTHASDPVCPRTGYGEG